MFREDFLSLKESILILLRAGLFGYSASQAAITISLLAVAPQLVAPSLRSVAWLSVLGCLSTVLVALTLLAAVALEVVDYATDDGSGERSDRANGAK